LAYVIQLVIKVILSAFNIKPTESKDFDNDINGRSVSNMIVKVWYQE
jgi:hypothetical protein